jgi:hypothetical protein
MIEEVRFARDSPLASVLRPGGYVLRDAAITSSNVSK